MSHSSVGWKDPLSCITSCLKQGYHQRWIRSALILSSWVIENLQGQSFTACLGTIQARTVLHGTVCFLYVEKGSGENKGEILSVTLIREIPIAEQEPS